MAAPVPIGESAGSWALVSWRPGGSTPALQPYPESNSGFQEGEPTWIAKPLGSGWQLLVDDEPLATCPNDASRWTWKPGFFAGEVIAELIDEGGRSVARYLLDVAPDATKSGREAFEQMLTEVRDLEPALLVGTEPPTLASGALGVHVDPMIEFARYRRYVSEFIRALEAIRSQPIRRLRAERTSLPIDRVRRVDRSTAISMRLNPAAIAFMTRPETAATSLTPPSIDVPLVETSDDSEANRCLAALARGIERRARTIAEGAQAQIERVDDHATRTSLSERWKTRAAFLEEYGRRVGTQRRRPPFGQVRNLEITSAGLNAVAAHPLYARAWRLGWKVLRPGAGIEDDAPEDRLWTSPTWEVYERWCFARLTSDLTRLRADLTWSGRVEFGNTRATARFVGEGAREKIEVLFQPSFPHKASPGRDDLWSIAKGRFPDIAILHVDATSRRFFILDAKYRTSKQNVASAMDSAHLYHDALRWGEDRAARSLLLIPRGGEADWLEEAGFHCRHGVGVAEFSVDEDGEELLASLGLTSC